MFLRMTCPFVGETAGDALVSIVLPNDDTLIASGGSKGKHPQGSNDSISVHCAEPDAGMLSRNALVSPKTNGDVLHIVVGIVGLQQSVECAVDDLVPFFVGLDRSHFEVLIGLQW